MSFNLVDFSAGGASYSPTASPGIDERKKQPRRLLCDEIYVGEIGEIREKNKFFMRFLIKKQVKYKYF